MATTAVKEIFAALPHIKKVGVKHLWFDFDEEADVLYDNGLSLRIYTLCGSFSARGATFSRCNSY
ncbi:hypothetical protein KKE26_11815 [bacterium]|nr:hypothetical protein [bacterium]MBU1754291.1 hypothetical protein [bacterium]